MKQFVMPTLKVGQFRLAEELMLTSGWMQFEEDSPRSFTSLNTVATDRDNNTRLG